MKAQIVKMNVMTLILLAANYALCRTDGNYTWFYVGLVGVPFVVASTIQNLKE